MDIGAFYGSVFYPSSHGSVGGGGVSPGGGVIKITTSELQMDGNIECKGGLYEKGINHGGGSGGSIYINTTNFRGDGVIDVSGGPGNGDGGGGSGGRIAVYYHFSSFTGQLTAFGGSSLQEAGAAGTIYQKDYRQNLQYLLVTNNNQKPRTSLVNFANPRKGNARTWLPAHTNDTQYTFDEVTLAGGSHLVMAYNEHDQKMVIGKLSDVKNNDFTSYLHVGQWQTINVRGSGIIFPVNIHVYKDGRLGLPQRTEIKKTTFNCEGHLMGLKELTVSDTTINFGVDSGSIISDEYVARHFVFERVTINAAGVIVFKNAEYGNVLETSKLEVKAKGLIQARILTIRSDNILVDQTARITVDSQAFAQEAANKNYGGQ